MKSRTSFLIIAVSFLALASLPLSAQAQSLTPQEKARLEQELAQVEAEQKKVEADLAATQAQSSSLQRDISILDQKIKAAQLNIRAKTLKIETLGNDIKQKERHIGALEDRIGRGKETLAQIMRKTNETSSYTLPEMLLSQATLTGFLEDIDSFESVQTGLKDTFEQIRDDKSETQAERDVLDKRRNAEIDARYTIEQEKKNIEVDEREKQRLLSISRSNEAAYSADLVKKRAKAAQIRAQLFPLRGAEPIPFGDAYRYAVAAYQKTGVRPAFLLGIFAQESSLDTSDATFGKHVGSCYLTDTQTGAGVRASTRTPIADVMKPSRDVAPFLEIVNALGGDPFTTLISCPLSTGYGGAMGPAQFIPSTWMLVKDRLARLLNISGMPNPWSPAHAFMASAMYLSDLGASAGTYTAERNAACKYYSGVSCGLRTGNTSYGNSVMANAERIQRTMIDPLQGL